MIVPKIKCAFLTNENEKLELICPILRKISLENTFILTSFNLDHVTYLILKESIDEVNNCDLVISTTPQQGDFVLSYVIGFAHSLGKPIIFLVEERQTSEKKELPFYSNKCQITYDISPESLTNFKIQLEKYIKNFLDNPLQFLEYIPPYSRNLPALNVDLDKLSNQGFENLFFEILIQMGFEFLEWNTDYGFDIIGKFVKKDPDGYVYDETWIINFANKRETIINFNEKMERLITSIYRLMFEKTYISKEKLLVYGDYFTNSNVTILIITPEMESTFFGEKGSYELIDRLQEISKDYFTRISKLNDNTNDSIFSNQKLLPLNFRIRVWGRNHLTNIIKGYPHIWHKYSSDVVLDELEYHKTKEDLNLNILILKENYEKAIKQLDEEKKKRFIAERDAAWKDVAFRGAHKLGVPIDVVETYLQILKRMVKEEDIETGRIIQRMENCIEDVKIVITQFKSITKSQEIKANPTDIYPLIQNVFLIAEEKGVKIEIETLQDTPKVYVDPKRISECFAELFANSLFWFSKRNVDDIRNNVIVIKIEIALKDGLPKEINSEKSYLRIIYEDNGPGIEPKNKVMIFAPFFTTSPHGTGLGLSLVKWLIEGNGGIVLEDGKVGEGVHFDIYLPTCEEE